MFFFLSNDIAVAAATRPLSLYFIVYDPTTSVGFFLKKHVHLCSSSGSRVERSLQLNCSEQGCH